MSIDILHTIAVTGNVTVAVIVTHADIMIEGRIIVVITVRGTPLGTATESIGTHRAARDPLARDGIFVVTADKGVNGLDETMKNKPGCRLDGCPGLADKNA